MRASTVYAVIAIVTFGVFSTVYTHEFLAYGDRQTIVFNPFVSQGLGVDGALEAFEIGSGRAWQPLSWISLQATRSASRWLGTGAAGPWLMTHVALHVLASLGLLFALSRLTCQLWPSAFVASVYALHPLQVEVVAWATARGEALAGVFLAVTLVAWSYWVERPTAGRYVCVVGATLLGTLSGPGFATLPFLLLVLDVWPLGRLGLAGERIGRFADVPAPSLSRLLGEKAPLLVIGGLGALTRHLSVQAMPNPWSSDPSLAARLAALPVNLVEAAARVVWPAQLAFTHPTRAQMGLGDPPVWQVLGALALIAGLAFVFARSGPRGRPLWAGWLWFVVLALPAAGLVPSGFRMLHDRDLQLALVGIALGPAFALAAPLARIAHGPAVAAGLAGAVLLGLGVASRAQTEVWRDTNSLYDHALAVNDRDAMAHFYKGMLLMQGGFDSASLDQLERVIEIQPAHAHANLAVGAILLDDERAGEAVPYLHRAVAGLPGSLEALTRLAEALWRTGDESGAMVLLDDAIREEPDSARLRTERGLMNERRGATDLAIADFEAALALDSGQGVARARLKSLERARASGANAPHPEGGGAGDGPQG